MQTPKSQHAHNPKPQPHYAPNAPTNKASPRSNERLVAFCVAWVVKFKPPISHQSTPFVLMGCIR